MNFRTNALQNTNHIMNKNRRNQIEEIITRVKQLHEDAKQLAVDTQEVLDDEQEYCDSPPPNPQHAEASEEAIGRLEEAQYLLDELDTTITDIFDFLTEAKQ